MHSSLPKVLHPVGGVAMILRVIGALREAGISNTIVVVGPDSEDIAAALPANTATAIQEAPLGTGDAVRAGLESIERSVDRLLVVGADTPLVSPDTLGATLDCVPPAAMALVAARVQNPQGYGRVLLDGPGRAVRIVEDVDATPDERATNLVSGMVFAFDVRWLRSTLPDVGPSDSGEVYLTDLVALATQSGRSVRVVDARDVGEIMGVNTRRQLAEAERVLRNRVNDRLMDAGVTILDPATTFIDESVEIGKDVLLQPQTFLRGRTSIGDGCTIGPGTEIVDSRLGRNVRVWWSVIEGATLADGVTVGPFGRIRPGAVLEDDVALGSFAEIKNSHVGARTQMHHFSYLGDAEVGADVNIGAGAITCNFDGQDKHRTVIGSDVFIGSDTMLIAPVTVERGAMTGAGSIVTRDVPADAVVVGAPARRIPRKPRRKAISQSDQQDGIAEREA